MACMAFDGILDSSKELTDPKGKIPNGMRFVFGDRILLLTRVPLPSNAHEDGLLESKPKNYLCRLYFGKRCDYRDSALVFYFDKKRINREGCSSRAKRFWTRNFSFKDLYVKVVLYQRRFF